MLKDGLKKKIIIGSRQSDLARIQALNVGQHLKEKLNIDVDFFFRPSFGDLDLDMDLAKTNSKGVFTYEFQELLKSGQCDLVVHSWKDLPIDENAETRIFTLNPREDQRDLLFLKKSSVGQKKLVFMTSSPRREYHLKKSLNLFLPSIVLDSVSDTVSNSPSDPLSALEFESIRGNIPTRFKKFLDSDCDGFVVAKAAVDRMMNTEADEFKDIRRQILDVFEKCNWMVLPLSEFPTAAAQGAIAIEILKTHPLVEQLIQINAYDIYDSVQKERQTHKQYGGGCHQAMGFSSLPTEFGSVFYASGNFEDKPFHYSQFNPLKKLNQKFKPHQLYSQTQMKSERARRRWKSSSEASVGGAQPHGMLASELDIMTNSTKAEFVITRYEARLEDLKNKSSTVWVSGNQTWMKLAQDGYWINGSLDGLGLKHKPNMSYLKPEHFYWLSNSSSPEDGINLKDNLLQSSVTSYNFKFIPTYDLSYPLTRIEAESLFKDKECFLWMSGHAFESVLMVYPEIKTKTHFCGLGRTVNTLKKHLKSDQIYFCKNEDDFLNQCL